MKFTPKTEQEIAEDGLIPANTICDFEVLEAEEKVSKAGNDMIALKLKVWRPSGSTTLIRDWLLADAMWKLRAFAESVDMLDAYEDGSMEAEDMVGKTGRAKVGVKSAEGDYPAANRITAYEKPNAKPMRGASRAQAATAPRGYGAGPKPGRATVSNLDDDIPFGPCM